MCRGSWNSGLILTDWYVCYTYLYDIGGRERRGRHYSLQREQDASQRSAAQRFHLK